MTGAVHLEMSGEIAVLRLDNPAKWNCFTQEMLTQMSAHLDRIEADENLRALVLASTGDKAFCSGADIRAWGALSARDFSRIWVVQGHRLFDRVAQLPIPTIAALNGHAFGGGLELATACDIRIMAPRAELALPEAGIGIVPGWSGTQRLARLIPPSVLKEMALFGRKLSAERAYQLGFVAEISGEAEAHALTLAKSVLTLSPRAIDITKRAIHAAIGEATPMMIDALSGAAAAATEDKAEGVNSFLEKRHPMFEGE